MTTIYKKNNITIINDNGVVCMYNHDKVNELVTLRPQYGEGAPNDTIEGNYADFVKEDGVTTIGTTPQEVEDYLSANVGFNLASGGNEVNQSAVTVIDEVFDANTDTNDFVLSGTGATITATANGLLLTNTGTTASNGFYGPNKNGLTIANLLGNIYPGWTCLPKATFEVEFEIVDAPVAGAVYFGCGVETLGEKVDTNDNGGAMIGYNSTLAKAYSDDQANSGLTFDANFIIGDVIKQVYTYWDGQEHILTYKNGTLQGAVSNNHYEVRQVYAGAADNNGRVGAVSLYVWGCSILVKTFKYIDSSQKCDTAIITDSKSRNGWSGYTSNEDGTYGTTIQTYSSKVVKVFGRPSMTFKDFYENCMHELEACESENVIVNLLTNSVLMSKSTATIEAEFTTGLGNVQATAGVQQVCVGLMPNVSGTDITAENVAVNDAADTVGNVDLFDWRDYLEVNPTTYILGMSTDLIHLSVLGGRTIGDAHIQDLPTYF